MTEARVVIRGRVERGEFKEPFRQCTKMLEQIGTSCRINSVITDEPTDFVLVFQSYPHEFLQADLVQLRRENPFAPFFFVLGACCEGMLRTAGSLVSPFYCYVHGWNSEEMEQIRRFLTEQPSLFLMPLTAENDEIAQWKNPGKQRVANVKERRHTSSSALLRLRLRSVLLPKCLILTHFGPFGNDSTMIRLLADEHVRLGYDPVFSGKTLPDAFSGKVLADADDSPKEKILETIQRLRQRFADNDFTVYVDSPRIDEKNGYVRAGVTRVLPKIR